MIKRIKSIKNLGIFNDYKIDGNLQEFNDKNIIYGWNYSGKTTLSRLFSYLDKENIMKVLASLYKIKYKIIWHYQIL